MIRHLCWSMAVWLVAWHVLAVAAPYWVGYSELPAAAPHDCPKPVLRHVVKCPPPHTVTTVKVTCLSTRRIDLCATH